MTTVPRRDSGTPKPPPIDPNNPLTNLAGRYLMRIDYYSKVSETRAPITLTVKNRVSNLFFTEVSVAGDRVFGSEKLCFQNSVHSCESGCPTKDDWKTDYAPELPAKIQERDPITRAYDVDDAGNVTVKRPDALLRLGFDDDTFSTSPLPENVDDPRVWKLPGGWRGVPTFLSGKVGPFDLACEVDSVQLFATAFKAKLELPLNQDSLTTRVIEIDADGSGAYPIAVGAGGKPELLCNLAELQKASRATDESGFVRFMRTDLRDCPPTVNDFEAEFPGGDSIEAPTPTDPLVR